jgi:pilus assembly protein CpaB
MKQKPVGLLVAFVLALIGTLLLVTYVQSARTEALSKVRLENVLVATRPIPKGTAPDAAAASMKLIGVPAKAKAPDALTALDTVKGKQTAIDIQTGEQILASRFVEPQKSAAELVGPGHVEVTVTMSPDQTVGGTIRIGSVVNLITTFPGDAGHEIETHIMLSNVKVTNVQTGTLPPAQQPKSATATTVAVNPAPSGSFMITLAVTPADAERVVFAAENGKLWLTAEGDVPTAGSKIVTRENVE